MQQIKSALITFIFLVVITGILYPLIITIFGQVFVPYQANGSLIKVHGQVVRSVLLGQYFSDNKYLWSRPSTTAKSPYNGLSAVVANTNPASIDFLHIVQQRVQIFATTSNLVDGLPPIDLVTDSASGLDPNISLDGANFQAKRIALARHIKLNEVVHIIQHYTIRNIFDLTDQPLVNVLQVNLALDHLQYQGDE